jgi:hypothetical protein
VSSKQSIFVVALALLITSALTMTCHVREVLGELSQETQETEKDETEDLISNGQITILEHQIVRTDSGFYVDVLYKVDKKVETRSVKIIIDCFDMDGKPYQGTHKLIPKRDRLDAGEIRKVQIRLPQGAYSYRLRLVKL